MRLDVSTLWVVTPNGAAIKAIRERSGMSASRLARLTRRSTSCITRIEGGEVHAPRPETIRRIAAALDVPIDAITKDAPKEKT